MFDESRLALENCEQEPIRIPGAIQSHGALLNVKPDDFTIQIASENCETFFFRSAESLIGTCVLDVVSPDQRDELKRALTAAELDAENPIRIAIEMGSHRRMLECIAHTHAGELILEFETIVKESEVDFKSFYHLATRSVESLRSAKSKAELYQRAVDEIRRITGFDRVVIYQFDLGWNGHVISESRSNSAHSYLDLRFPASDIPKQVRDLYSLNPLRMIPATLYKPSRLIGDSPEKRLDLSRAGLRNVSPVHVEYLKNMEVTASMSISIHKHSQLWGLISCAHENGANFVSYDRRAVCTFLAATLSSLLPQFEDKEDSELRERLAGIQNRLVIRMSEATRFVDGLFSKPEELLEIADATGAAFFIDGEWRGVGTLPNLNVLNAIREHINTQPGNAIFATENLRTTLGTDFAGPQEISGCLGYSISKSKTNYLLWFRPEVVRTVNWGGNPNKPVEFRDDKLVLHPRKSFEKWKEIVRGKCAPWKKEELAAVENLKLAISDIVLQRVEQITNLNAQLERSNVELDSFAYAASHDLKEPLRGISNFASMVLKDANNVLSENGKSRMQTILRLTQRSEDLINSLLGYSKLGRQEMMMEKVDLNEIVRGALESIATKINETNTEVSVGQLSTVVGDRTQLNEVFTNLIMNGIKYNESVKKHIWIEEVVADETPGVQMVTVSDNGIGIDKDFHQAIFKIFKRLHAKNDFGGGSGTGLTIVKKILDRHGASINVASEVGTGTKFLLTFHDSRSHETS